ncbi:MAG: aminotransferase class V-fold PLP-dependent enzyme [Candidatus Limnocylindrales bacterium]
MVTPFLPDDEKIPAIREALPSTAAGIYLNTGSAGPLPRETARAMAEAEAWELRTGRADPNHWRDALERMAEARAAIAAVIGADPAQIALTHATTDGMNMATWAVDWRPGDRAVTTNLEHAGGLGPLWAVRHRLGVELTIADIGNGADPAAVLATLDRAIVPGTRLVSLSQVTWATGARLPIREIAEMAHLRGALVAVDGAQAVGAIPVSVDELGADFYAVPGQKWLLGPEGIGAVYCAPSVLDRPRMAFAGYFSFESMDLAGEGKPWADARRFEASNYHQPSVLGLARSAAWLSMFVGWPWIHERIERLAGEAVSMLAEVPGVDVLTPRGNMAGLVTFRIAGWKSTAALKELSQRTLCIARTIPPLDAIRISVGFYNTDAELRRFRDGVALVASNTPETIPHRPQIEVLRGGVD